MVKLKITRYNLKGVDDCGSDKSFAFIAGSQAEVTMKSSIVVSVTSLLQLCRDPGRDPS